MGQVHHLDISPDHATARGYARAVRTACDELHADPYDRQARAEILRLIVEDSSEADAALVRALAAPRRLTTTPPAATRTAL
jgi:hypothetical protein